MFQSRKQSDSCDHRRARTDEDQLIGTFDLQLLLTLNLFNPLEADRVDIVVSALIWFVFVYHYMVEHAVSFEFE